MRMEPKGKGKIKSLPELLRMILLVTRVNEDQAAIAVDRKCTQQPVVVGIHIAAPANRSTEESSPRNGRAATHALVQPQGRELRVEGGAKER